MKKYTKSFVTGSGESIAIDMDKSSVRVMDLYVYDLEGETALGKDEAAARESNKIGEEKRNSLKDLLSRQREK